MKVAIKTRALKLRQRGWSYNVIAERLGVSKSTLSNWLKEVPYRPNKTVLQRVARAPAKSAVIKNRQKIQSIVRGRIQGARDVGRLSKRDLFMVGVGLYIGEGTKTNESIRFINSDPNVIRTAIKWFRDICGLGTKNFHVAIHLYPDVSEKEAVRYWSRATGIPPGQFGKVQTDRRKDKSVMRKRKLPYGTAHVYIRSCGNPTHGKELHRRIMGWIEAIYKQVRV